MGIFENKIQYWLQNILYRVQPFWSAITWRYMARKFVAITQKTNEKLIMNNFYSALSCEQASILGGSGIKYCFFFFHDYSQSS